MIASFVLAIAWPSTSFVSASPKTRASSARGEGTDRVTRAPIRFNMVGATWDTQAPEGAMFRTSVDGTTWTEWKALEVDDIGGDTDDEKKSDRISEPVWVGDARFIQTRGFGSGKLEFVNTKGTADDPSKAVIALRAFGRWLTTARPAHAGIGPVGIYTRAQWGADESLRQEAPEYATTNRMAFIHHTDGTNSYATGEVPSVIRAIYYYHVKVRDYRDIAYNFLVDRFGRLWEGRWGGMTKTVIGGHTAGLNSGSIGVAMLGTYSSLTPSRATQDAIARLLSWKFTIHKIRPRGSARMTVNNTGAKWPSGSAVTLNTISGHRDGVATACPGNAGYSTLPYIRSRTHARVLPHGSFVLIGTSVWRITSFGRQPVPSAQVLSTHIPTTQLLRLTPEEAWSVPAHSRVIYRDGTLVQGDTSSSVYVVSDGMLRGFRSSTDFVRMGFKWDRILKTSTAFLRTIPAGPAISPAAYPDGVLIRASGASTVYRIVDGKRVAMAGAVFASWYFSTAEILTVPAATVNAIAGAGYLGFRDGTLLKSSSSSSVYVISDGLRRGFSSAAVFAELGYKWDNVRVVPSSLISMHALGKPVDGFTN